VDWVVLIAGTALALAGLLNDDVWAVVLCSVVAAACFMYLAWVRVTRIPARAVVILIVALVFAYFGWKSYSRIVQAKQDDAYNHLTVEMGKIELGGPMILLYTVRNGGSATIKRHKVTCVFNRIMARGGGSFEVKEIVGKWDDSPISGGGDAYTGRCFTEFMSFSGAPVVCADVTIKVTYELEIQPNKQVTKPLRFVATETSGPRWYQESPNTQGNYCDGTANVMK